MITRRVSTKMPAEPPVRFYRTIAVTFLILTIVLLGVVIFFTSKKATIVIAAKSDNKNINLSIDVAEAAGVGSLSGVITSTEFYWAEKYYPTGNKTTDDIAVGEVILYNESSADQPLVQTTRLLSANKILFRLSEGVIVPAKGQINAKVYADQKGVGGNITSSAFTIPGLSDDQQKLIYAKSVQTMAGGVKQVGALTSDDLQTAKNSYAAKVKQAFLVSSSSFLADDKLKNKEKIVYAKNDAVKNDKKIGEEIKEFSLSGTSTIVVVYYDKTELQSITSKELAKKVDTESEQILAIDKSPQVSLISYDLSKSVARLSVYQDILVTLDANGAKLAAINFFGKSKDEIERHILGLSHVVSVDVKFSPSWMGTAPSVTDKIKVIVKNIK